jgi:hypothetical protein
VAPPFKVLGTGADRYALQAAAQPLEMVVIHGFTREVDEAFQRFRGRPEEFWVQHAELIETARKLDEVLAGIQARSRA